ncbi:MAG TPA: DUF547 domain-containing protein [Planctomycetaceae bacterium]|nr:DUF547 domain-containing protein [Planctomycetaceae bacterium]
MNGIAGDGLWRRKGGFFSARKVAAGWLFALAFLPLASAQAGKKWYVGSRHPASQLVSIDKIDHSVWNDLLRKYVDKDGKVDYAAWKASPGDMARLDRYLSHLSSADPSRSASRAAKLAFWINAYNAVTIRGILREYPTTSIRRHTSRFGGYNIWKDLLLIVGDHAYSLEHMEHQILRKMKEPRIHFAIVCASNGCPILRNEAYVAQNLERQLEENARRFFQDPSKLRFDPRTRRLMLSPILKWFQEDFGSSPQEVLAAIRPYLPESVVRAATHGGVEIDYLSYDWNLNDRRSVARRH